jgi:hypothetical protein
MAQGTRKASRRADRDKENPIPICDGMERAEGRFCRFKAIWNGNGHFNAIESDISETSKDPLASDLRSCSRIPGLSSDGVG